MHTSPRRSALALLALAVLATSACEQAEQAEQAEDGRVEALEVRVARLEEQVAAVDRATAASLPAGKEESVQAVLFAIRERRDPRAMSDGKKVTFCLVSGWTYGDLELLRLHIDLERVYRAQALSLLDADDVANAPYSALLATSAGPSLQAAGDRLSRVRALLEAENWTRSREIVREPVE